MLIQLAFGTLCAPPRPCASRTCLLKLARARNSHRFDLSLTLILELRTHLDVCRLLDNSVLVLAVVAVMS